VEPSRRRARPALAAVAAAALAGAACAHAPEPKVSFADAGLLPAVEPDGPVLPPAKIPAPRKIASEPAEGPPVDAALLRFAADARARRVRLPAARDFPDEVVTAWTTFGEEIDRYLARPLPQTPLLELVRARVTLEAEWDYDVRRFGRAPDDLGAAQAGRIARLARRVETVHALRQGLFPKRPAPRIGWPIERAGLSSTFGQRVDPIDGTRRMHYGIDLAAEVGRVVFSAAKGYVVRAGWIRGYGLLVEVRHPGDLVTRYSHLSRLLCAPGDALDAGQALGLVGATGRATGPHLHFEVWSGGQPRDPLAWLGEREHDGAAGN
jgi:murein DD-endopeptidase MepM/ murein hydrolase activator NlpD